MSFISALPPSGVNVTRCVGYLYPKGRPGEPHFRIVSVNLDLEFDHEQLVPGAQVAILGYQEGINRYVAAWSGDASSLMQRQVVELTKKPEKVPELVGDESTG